MDWCWDCHCHCCCCCLPKRLLLLLLLLRLLLLLIYWNIIMVYRIVYMIIVQLLAPLERAQLGPCLVLNILKEIGDRSKSFRTVQEIG